MSRHFRIARLAMRDESIMANAKVPPIDVHQERQDILVGPLVTHSARPLLRSELDRVLAGQGSAAAPVVEASSGWLVCAMVGWGRLGRHGSFHGNRTSEFQSGCLRPETEDRPVVWATDLARAAADW